MQAGDDAASEPRIAVVIPSFRASATIAGVVRAIGSAVWRIYVVDDACPEASGEILLRDCSDDRVRVLSNLVNLGVGGAVKQGYQAALAEGADIVVKLDADGQMDPGDIAALITPIRNGTADYAKGNRFGVGSRAALRTMPFPRRLTNRLLSAAHRPATGYWKVGDPANGYTAINAAALRRLDLNRISSCFFFETDMLFALARTRARVAEVSLPARYSGEVSSVSLTRVAPRFAALLLLRGCERIAAAVRA